MHKKAGNDQSEVDLPLHCLAQHDAATLGTCFAFNCFDSREISCQQVVIGCPSHDSQWNLGFKPDVLVSPRRLAITGFARTYHDVIFFPRADRIGRCCGGAGGLYPLCCCG